MEAILNAFHHAFFLERKQIGNAKQFSLFLTYTYAVYDMSTIYIYIYMIDFIRLPCPESLQNIEVHESLSVSSRPIVACKSILRYGSIVLRRRS
jgi:hypothetical protein